MQTTITTLTPILSVMHFVGTRDSMPHLSFVSQFPSLLIKICFHVIKTLHFACYFTIPIFYCSQAVCKIFHNQILITV